MQNPLNRDIAKFQTKWENARLFWRGILEFYREDREIIQNSVVIVPNPHDDHGLLLFYFHGQQIQCHKKFAGNFDDNVDCLPGNLFWSINQAFSSVAAMRAHESSLK